VVLWPGTGSPVIIGNQWRSDPDGLAAGGMRLTNLNAGVPKIVVPAASPSSYVEVRFAADKDKPYHIWLRMSATANDWVNDSVHMQFSDAVDATGAPIARIGTTSSLWFSLENDFSAGLNGWGWQDNAFGTGALGAHVQFAATGEHVLRFQQREDGIMIDQIVISAVKYLTTSPGMLKSDSTILPKQPVVP
jgi:hypothetical protein